MAVTLELQPDGALKISRILRAPAAIIAASRALESIVEAAYEPVAPVVVPEKVIPHALAAAALRDMTIERAERDEGQGEAEPPRKDWTACNAQTGECE